MHIVLVEPEIPNNTGNIARTCAATGATLHLVEPLGFSLEDRYLRRAGLDYWPMVTMKVWPDLSYLREAFPAGRFLYATTKTALSYCQIRYQPEDFLVFGKETSGLPEEIWRGEEERTIRVPMRAGARSHNLSNTVAIVLYEALRQMDFPGLI